MAQVGSSSHFQPSMHLLRVFGLSSVLREFRSHCVRGSDKLQQSLNRAMRAATVHQQALQIARPIPILVLNSCTHPPAFCRARLVPSYNAD